MFSHTEGIEYGSAAVVLPICVFVVFKYADRPTACSVRHQRHFTDSEVSQYSKPNVMQFIKILEPPHVSSITCSPSGGPAQATLGVLRACYVSWLHQDWRGQLT
jgi:hypothetical protein